MGSGSNWIEESVSKQKRLQAESGLVWEALRSAVQDACESFWQHYEMEGWSKLTDKVENGFRMLVSIFFHSGASRRTAIVYFKPEMAVITWPTNDGPEYVRISVDEKEVFLSDEKGSRLSPDEVSRLILKPLLFPDDGPYKLNHPNNYVRS